MAPLGIYISDGQKGCVWNEDMFMNAEFKKDQVAFMQKIACPTFKKLHEFIRIPHIWYARCLANTERWEGTIPQAL